MMGGTMLQAVMYAKDPTSKALAKGIESLRRAGYFKVMVLPWDSQQGEIPESDVDVQMHVQDGYEAEADIHLLYNFRRATGLKVKVKPVWHSRVQTALGVPRRDEKFFTAPMNEANCPEFYRQITAGVTLFKFTRGGQIEHLVRATDGWPSYGAPQYMIASRLENGLFTLSEPWWREFHFAMRTVVFREDPKRDEELFVDRLTSFHDPSSPALPQELVFVRLGWDGTAPTLPARR